MMTLPAADRLNRFFLLSWFWLILHVSMFTTPAQYAGPVVTLWTLATTLSYAFIYLLPALLVGHLLRWTLDRMAIRAGAVVLATVLIVLTGLIHVLLFADRVIHGMYGFHIKSPLQNSPYATHS